MTRDEVIQKLGQLMAGLQVPISLALPLGVGGQAWRELSDALDVGFGWKTDVEYADYLLAQKNAGKLGDVQIFPTVHGAVGGDPRDKYSAAQKPWFVVFDGDANTWVTQTGPWWYDANHYYVVMTDGQNVAPAIDAHNPTVDQANQRVAELAKQHASVITSDWTGLTTVLPQVLPRG